MTMKKQKKGGRRRTRRRKHNKRKRRRRRTRRRRCPRHPDEFDKELDDMNREIEYVNKNPLYIIETACKGCSQYDLSDNRSWPRDVLV